MTLAQVTIKFVIFAHIINTVFSANKNNFFGEETSGPFELHVVGATNCVSTFENAIAHIDLNLKKISRKDAVLSGSVSVFKDSATVSANIKNFIWGDGGWKPSFLSINIPNICSVEMIAEVLIKYLHANDECELKQGIYNFSDFYPEASIRDVLGDEANYGKTRSQISMYSGEDPMICVSVDIEIIPSKN